MIDKVYILNIATETRRRDLCYQKLCEAGTPAEKIEVFEASTHDQFEKTRQLCEAAAAEKFGFFQKLLDTKYYNTCHIGYLAQAWSYLRFYRHIQETGETAILLHDDNKFQCSYNDLQNVCQGLPPSFLFAVLQVGDVPNVGQWIKGTPWIKGFVPNGSPRDYGILYNPNRVDFLFRYLEDNAERCSLGWLANSLWHIEDDGIWTLFINPVPENLEQLNEIIESIFQNGYSQEYMTIHGISELALDSSLHDLKTGAVRRLAELTKD